MKYFTMDRDEASTALAERSISISVFGLGKMGLPICAAFLNEGYTVVGVDINIDLISKLNKGIVTLIGEPGVYESIKTGIANKKFSATLSIEEALKSTDLIIIIIPLLVNEDKEPILSPLTDLITQIGKYLEKGHLIIQETTLPIGTTEKILKPILEETSGLIAGEDFGLGFSPERTYSGRVLADIIVNYPKIVGGINEKSTDRIADFYSTFVQKGVIKMNSATTAEAVKVFKGVYRDMNIAIANELAKIAEELGVNFYEVRDAVNSEPAGNILMPGAGVGGHCIPVYPHFLLHSLKELGTNSEFIEVGRKVNVSMASHVVEKIKNETSIFQKQIMKSKIVLLGLAYRGNVKEHRNSPTLNIISLLRNLGVEVTLHDPLYSKEEVDSLAQVNFTDDLYKALEGADCIVLLADHVEYKELSFSHLEQVANIPYIFIDTKNIITVDSNETRKIVKIGV